RQHGLLHEHGPLLPHRRRQPPAPAAALSLLHDPGPAREPLPRRPLAGALPPRPQLPRGALPEPGREAAHRLAPARPATGGRLGRHGVEVLLNRGVRALEAAGDRVGGVQLRDGAAMTADWYVAAVPFDRLLDLLPGEVVEGHPYFCDLRRLETSPITSVHVWYD